MGQLGVEETLDFKVDGIQSSSAIVGLRRRYIWSPNPYYNRRPEHMIERYNVESCNTMVTTRSKAGTGFSSRRSIFGRRVDKKRPRADKVRVK